MSQRWHHDTLVNVTSDRRQTPRHPLWQQNRVTRRAVSPLKTPKTEFCFYFFGFCKVSVLSETQNFHLHCTGSTQWSSTAHSTQWSSTATATPTQNPRHMLINTSRNIPVSKNTWTIIWMLQFQAATHSYNYRFCFFVFLWRTCGDTGRH